MQVVGRGGGSEAWFLFLGRWEDKATAMGYAKGGTPNAARTWRRDLAAWVANRGV